LGLLDLLSAAIPPRRKGRGETGGFGDQRSVREGKTIASSMALEEMGKSLS